ncbi:hypothetical protein NHX12_017974 [Muraenolepis orangiensis]|uniref:Uncharacterized protein n=1 Tax=Muraenolepis orangiensis TaxID=630683 RepID=A0A9Q0EVW4_9TELE|nr:hypothetical protein NHX12_017974 [Muraenolepis orangiensis]
MKQEQPPCVSVQDNTRPAGADQGRAASGRPLRGHSRPSGLALQARSPMLLCLPGSASRPQRGLLSAKRPWSHGSATPPHSS